MSTIRDELAAVLPTNPDEWRAITLWQPWASLIAEGVKWIETRPRRCNWRGWVMIHAAKRVPYPERGPMFVGDYHVAQDGTWLHGPGVAAPMPFGAVVAVARLTDCLPMTGWADLGDSECIVVHDDALDHAIPEDTHINGPQAETGSLVPDGAHLIRDISDQRPYGDFAPGRYGLLLAEVHKLTQPVPATGSQAVPWRVDQDLVDRVLAQVDAS